jgi:hypothetical protein
MDRIRTYYIRKIGGEETTIRVEIMRWCGHVIRTEEDRWRKCRR